MAGKEDHIISISLFSSWKRANGIFFSPFDAVIPVMMVTVVRITIQWSCRNDRFSKIEEFLSCSIILDHVGIRMLVLRVD